ncbi:MAG: translocation/assembly module TamB domain-containing protein [Gammaproteobacteria bacterium]|nr:translocation/assembly module TamB domain-containing protein [Gammaproteobacteria bacterium]
MSRKLVLASLGMLSLAAVVAVFLLGTTAGLRLVLDQGLTRSGAPVEIDAVRGRILGGVALSGVSYLDPEAGTRVRVDTVELDWRPTALLGGRLHVTRLHASGVEYTPGQSAGSTEKREATIPEVPVPLSIRIDEFQLEDFAMADEAGSIRTIIRYGSLRALVDADRALLTDVTIDAGGFSIKRGRIRAGFGAGMPLEASLGWRAARPDLPAVSGGLTVDGTLGGSLAPVIEVEAPFTARGRGTITNVLDTPRWDFQTSVPGPVGLDTLFPSLPPVSFRGGVRVEGDTASTRVTPDLSLEYNDGRMTLTGEVDVSTDAVVIRRARLARAVGPDTVNLSGRLAFGDDLPFEISADWQALHGPEHAPWASPSGRLSANGDLREATATLSGAIIPPGQDEATPVSLEVAVRDLDTAPGVSGSVRLPRFSYAGIDGSDIIADIAYRAADDADSSIVLTAARLRTAGGEASGVVFRASGAPPRHQASLSGNLDGWAVDTTLAGSYGDGRWTARLEQLTAESPDSSGLGKWALAAPADLTWSPTRSGIAALCLKNEEARLCADGYFAGQGEWKATAGLTGLPLRQLAVNAPQALRIDGTLDVDMEIGDRGDGMTGDARAAVQHATVAWEAGEPVTTAYRDVVAKASLNPDALRATLEGRVDEAGSIQGELVTRAPLAEDGEIQGSLSAELPSLRVIQAAVPALGLRQGTARLALSVEGTRSAPKLSGDGRIADAVLDVAPLGIQLSNLQLDLGSEDGRRVNIDARADAGEGSVSADGHVDLPPDGDAPSFAVQGRWQSLRGPEQAAWRSRSGEFEAEGGTRALTASVLGSITAPGQDDESTVSLDVTASGLDAEPEINGSARLPYFVWGETVGRGIAVDIDYRSAGEAVSDILVQASELRIAGRDASGIELRVNGKPAGHEATLSGQVDGWEIESGLSGSYRDDHWTGRLERLSASPPPDSGWGQWVLTQPADFSWSPSRTEVAALCLESEDTGLCADGFFAGQGDWHVAAELNGLPLRQLARETPQALRIDGSLSAKAELGNRGEGVTGAARAGIDRATIAWEGEEPVTTAYRDMVAKASLNPDALRATLEGRVDEAGSIQGELVTRAPLAEDGEIQGSLSAELPSLRVIQAAVPALGLRQGTARLALSVEGTRSAPKLSGDGRIANAVLDVAPLGIQLSNLQLDLGSDDSRRFEISARADSGDGSMSADGHIEWPDDGGWQGEIQVRGDQAELVRTPRALIHGSPDLRVTADETGGTVSGRVPITRAELTPESGRPGVAISDDFVIKGADEEDEATRNPLAWHARVSIELGDDTRFRGYGMKARLSGAIDIDAPPGQPTRANGSIRIHDGEYTLYGRSFNIGRGRLVYTGGPVDNPGIDVEVVKDVRDVSVSMAITGQLAEPELRLSSTPTMSETDQMSYLLLGHPASQASEAEAGLLLQAAASLLPGGGGSGVPRYIQSTLGLDTLDVRTDSTETEGAAVEVGKYLGPDLYVSYIAGFQQGVDIFRVRYELARHWLLQAESTTRGSGGDVLFTW